MQDSNSQNNYSLPTDALSKNTVKEDPLSALSNPSEGNRFIGKLYNDEQPTTVYYGSRLSDDTDKDDNLTYGDLFTNLEYVKAKNQSGSELLGNAFGRLGTSVATKTLEGLGYIGGAIAWAGIAGADTDKISMVTNNAFSELFRSIEEKAKEAMPIYKSKKYYSKNILDVIGTAGFWGDDFVDGLAFMISAFIPGIAWSKAGLAAKTANMFNIFAKTTSAIKAGGSAADIAFNSGGFTASSLNSIAKGSSVAVHTIYNTVSEAMFEAKDFRDGFIKEMQAERLQGLNNLTDEEIISKSNEGAAETFRLNVGVLLPSNLLEGSLVFGGALGKLSKAFGKTSKLANLESFGVDKSFGSYFGNILYKGTRQAASEGLWEENAQAAIQNYEKAKQSGETDLGAIEYMAYEMTEGLSTNVDTQKQVILGAILGFISGGAFSGIQKSKEDAYNQRIYTALQSIKDPEVLKKALTPYYEKDATGKFILDSNGNNIIDTKKMADAIESSIETMKQGQMLFESLANKDYDMLDYIVKDIIAGHAYRILSEEDATDYLKSKFSAAIDQLAKDNPGALNGKDINDYKKETGAYIDLLKKHYDLADKTTASFYNLDLDPKKDFVLRENIKNRQYRNSVKQKYLIDKISELDKKIGEYDFLGEDITKDHALINRLKKSKEALESELVLTKEEYKGLIDVSAIKTEAKEQREFNKEFNGTKEEVAFVNLLRGKLASVFGRSRANMIISQDASKKENNKISNFLKSQEFNSLPVEEKIKKLGEIISSLSVIELLTSTKIDLLNQIDSINEDEINNKINTLKQFENLEMLLDELTDQESGPALLKELEDLTNKDVVDKVVAGINSGDYSLLNDAKKNISSAITRLDNVLKSKKLIKDSVESKQAVVEFEDPTKVNLSKVAYDLIKNDYLSSIDNFESKLSDEEFIDIPGIKRYITSLELLKKIAPRMYQLTQDKNVIDKLQSEIEDALKRANAVLEVFNKRKQDRDALEERMHKDDAYRKLQSIGINVVNDVITDNNSTKFFELFGFSDRIKAAYELLKKSFATGVSHNHIQGLLYAISMEYKSDKIPADAKQTIDNYIIEHEKDSFKRASELAMEISQSEGNKDQLLSVLKRYKENPRRALYTILTQMSSDKTSKKYDEFVSRMKKFISRNNNTLILLQKFKEELNRIEEVKQQDGSIKIIDAYTAAEKEDINKNYLESLELFFNVHEKFVQIIDLQLALESGIIHVEQLSGEKDILRSGESPAPSLQQRLTLYQVIRALTSKRYNASIIKGIAGSGKTMLVRWILKALKLKSDSVFFMSFDKESVDNLIDSSGILNEKDDTVEERNRMSSIVEEGSSYEDFKNKYGDSIVDKRLVILDEFAYLGITTVIHLYRLITELNKSGSNIKLLLLGDPSQLRSTQNDPFMYYGSKFAEGYMNEYMDQTYEASSLNLKYRTPISDIDNTSELYQSGLISKRKHTTYVDNIERPETGAGVFNKSSISKFFTALSNNIKIGREATIIYDGSDETLNYIKKELADKYGLNEAQINKIEFLKYLSAQGKTRNNVYVFIDQASKELSNEDYYNRAMYVATSRARSLMLAVDLRNKINFEVLSRSDQKIKTNDNPILKETLRVESEKAKYLNDIAAYGKDVVADNTYGSIEINDISSGEEVSIVFEETTKDLDGNQTEENLINAIDNKESQSSSTDGKPKAVVDGESYRVTTPQYGLFDDSLPVGSEVFIIPVDIDGQRQLWVVRSLDNNTYLKVSVLEDSNIEKMPEAVKLLKNKSVIGLDGSRIIPAGTDTKDGLRNNVVSYQSADFAERTVAIESQGIDTVGAVVSKFNPIKFLYSQDAQQDVIDEASIVSKVVNALQKDGEIITDVKITYKIFKTLDDQKTRDMNLSPGLPYLIITYKSNKRANPTPLYILARPKEIKNSNKLSSYKPLLDYVTVLNKISAIYKHVGIDNMAVYGGLTKNGLKYKGRKGEKDRTTGSTFYTLLIQDLTDEAINGLENFIKAALTEEEYSQLQKLRLEARELAGIKTVEAENGFENIGEKGIKADTFSYDDLDNFLEEVSHEEYREFRATRKEYSKEDKQIDIAGTKYDVIKKSGNHKFAIKVFKVKGISKSAYVSFTIPLTDDGLSVRPGSTMSIHVMSLSVPYDVTSSEGISQATDKQKESLKKQILDGKSTDGKSKVHTKVEVEIFDDNNTIKTSLVSDNLKEFAFYHILNSIVKGKRFKKGTGSAQAILDDIAKSNVYTKSGTNIRTVSRFKGNKIIKAKSILNSNPQAATKSYYVNKKNEVVSYVTEPLTLESLRDIVDFANNGLILNIKMDQRSGKFTNNREDVSIRLKDIVPTNLEISFDGRVIKQENDPFIINEEPTTNNTQNTEPIPEDDNDEFGSQESEYDISGRSFNGELLDNSTVSKSEAVAILQETFPGITEEEIGFVDASTMIYLTGGKLVYGYFKNGIIYLLTDKNDAVYETVLRHETFHKVFWSFLDNDERVKMIEIAREFNPSLRNKSITEVEEYLADRFSSYAKNKKTKLGKLIRFFKKIYNFLTFNLNNWNAIEGYFDKIYNGYYSIDKIIEQNPIITRTMALTNRAMMNIEMYEKARNYLHDAMSELMHPYNSSKSVSVTETKDGDVSSITINGIALTRREAFKRLASVQTKKDNNGKVISSVGGSLLERYIVVRNKIKTASEADKLTLFSEKQTLEFLLFNNKGIELANLTSKAIVDILNTFNPVNIKETEDDVHEFESNLKNEISEGDDVDLLKNANGLVKEILSMVAVRDSNGKILYIPSASNIYNLLNELSYINTESKNIRLEIENAIKEKFTQTNQIANAILDKLVTGKGSLYGQMTNATIEVNGKTIALPNNVRFLGQNQFIIDLNGNDISNIVTFPERMGYVIINRQIGGNTLTTNKFFSDIMTELKNRGMALGTAETLNETASVINAMFIKERSRSNFVSLMSFIKSSRIRKLIFGTSIYSDGSQAHVLSYAGNIMSLTNAYASSIKNRVIDKTANVKTSYVAGILGLDKSTYEKQKIYVAAFLNFIGVNINKTYLSISRSDIRILVTGINDILTDMKDISDKMEYSEKHKRKEKIKELLESTYKNLILELAANIVKEDSDNRSYNIFGKDKKMRYVNVLTSWAMDAVNEIVIYGKDENESRLPIHLQNKFIKDYNIFLKNKDKEKAMSRVYEITDWMNQVTKGLPNFTSKEYADESEKDFLRREFLFQFVSVIARDSFDKNQTYYASPYTIGNKKIMHGFEVDLLNTDNVREAIKQAILQEFSKPEQAKELSDKGQLPNSFEYSKFIFGAMAGENISDYSLDDVDELVERTMQYVLNDFEVDYNKITYEFSGSSMLPNSDEFEKAHANLVESGFIVDKTDSKIKDLYKIFYLNNFVNSYFLGQIYLGQQSFYGNHKSVHSSIIKRSVSSYGIGQSPFTGNKGVKKTTKIGIMDDFWDIKTPLNNWSGIYEDSMFTSYETTNGETYMTQEYYDELKYNGYGYDYNIGEILKPIIYYVGSDGKLYMLKTSVVVLNEKMTKDFPELKQIRDKMRESGYDMMTYPSAFKYGAPKTINGFFDFTKGTESSVEVDTKDFRLQFNPYYSHEQEKGVKLLTQFTYIASIGEHNEQVANNLYNALSKIVEIQTRKYAKKFIKNGVVDSYRLRKVIIDALSNVSGSELIADAMAYKASREDKAKLIYELENGIAPTEEQIKEISSKYNLNNGYLIDNNLPDISKKILSVIISNFSKSSVEIKLKGGKFVLQESVNAKIYESNGIVKLYSSLTNNERSQADAFYSHPNIIGNYRMMRAIVELTEANKHEKLAEYLRLIASSEITGENRNREIYDYFLKDYKSDKEKEARLPDDIDFSKNWFSNLTENELNILRGYIEDGKLSSSFKNDFKNVKIPRRLSMVNNEGIPSAEVIMPITQAQKLAKKYGYKDIFELMNETVGVRIPTSGFNTTLLIKIVAFTDGNRIIIPEEVSLIHGSDFDVDSIFILNYEQYTAKDYHIFDESDEATDDFKIVIQSKLKLEKGVIIGRDKNGNEIKDFKEKIDEVREYVASNAEFLYEYNAILNTVTTFLDNIEIKYWKNYTLDQYKNVLKDPKNFKERMSPVSMDIISNYISKKISTEIYGRNPKETRDINLFSNKRKSHKDSFSSSKDIGIIASGVRTLSYLSFLARSNGRRLALNSDSGLLLDFNNNTYSVEQDKELYSSDGFSFNVTRLYDSFLNGAIDDVKNQTMYILNFTSLTAGSYSLMTKFGVPFWTQYLFHSQPIISAFTNPSVFDYSISNIESELKEALGLDKSNINLSDKLMSESLKYFVSKNIDLSKAIETYKTNPTAEIRNHLELQLKVLELFKKSKAAANSLISVSSMFDSTRSLPNTVYELQKVLDTYKENLPYFSFEDAGNSSIYRNLVHLKSATDSINFLMNNIITKEFDIYSSSMDNIVRNLSDFVNIEKSKFNNRENEEFVRTEFVKYLLSSYSFRKVTQTGKIVDDVEDLEYRLHDTDIAKVVVNNKIKLLNADDSWIESFCNEVKKQQIIYGDSNAFLKHIKVEENEWNGTHYLEFNIPPGSDISLKQKAMVHFLRLNKKPNVGSYNDFQKGFLKYSIIKYGNGFEATGFSQYMPIEIRSGVSNYLKYAFVRINNNPIVASSILHHFSLSLAIKHPKSISALNRDFLSMNDDIRENIQSDLDEKYVLSNETEKLPMVVSKRYSNGDFVIYRKVRSFAVEDFFKGKTKTRTKFATIYRKVSVDNENYHYDMPAQYLFDPYYSSEFKIVYGDHKRRIKNIDPGIDLSKKTIIFSEYTKGTERKEEKKLLEKDFGETRPLKVGDQIYLKNGSYNILNKSNVYTVVSSKDTIKDGYAARIYTVTLEGNAYTEELDKVKEERRIEVQNIKETSTGSVARSRLIDLVLYSGLETLSFGYSVYKAAGTEVSPERVAERSEDPYEVLQAYKTAYDSYRAFINGADASEVQHKIYLAFKNGLRLLPDTISTEYKSGIIKELLKDKNRKRYFSDKGMSLNKAITENNFLTSKNQEIHGDDYITSGVAVTAQNVKDFIDKFSSISDYEQHIENKYGLGNIEHKFFELTGVKLNESVYAELQNADEKYNLSLKNNDRSAIVADSFGEILINKSEVFDDFEDKEETCLPF